MRKLKKLFEPIRIGNITLENRIVMISMSLGYRDGSGRPTERLKRFLIQRAQGGTGLILTSTAPPFTTISMRRATPEMRDDSYVPAWREIVEAVHSYGVKIGAQISPFPSKPMGAMNTQQELVGPSAVAIRSGAPSRRALTVDEIHAMVEACGDTARRAREAGFDCVEIQAGIGAIVNRFISPATNRRGDEYGGSLQNRMRFLLEIIENIRRKAGADFTLSCKMCATDFVEGGYELEQYKEVAVILEQAGIALLNVQPGWHDSPVPLAQKEIPIGHWAYLSEGIKKAVKIPVMPHYRFNDPLIAESILAQGKADLIGIGRALIADPEFVKKAKEGELDDIRHCICCMRCMDQAVDLGIPVDICSVNAQVGEDIDIPVELARERKNVSVIGGGPAGMEAARIAASRGHQVTLYEKCNHLGGALLLGTVLRPENGKLLRYLTRQLKKLEVRVKLGVEVTCEMIAKDKPDVVVVASGGTSLGYDIPGVGGDNVIGFREVSGIMSGHAPSKNRSGIRMLWSLACLYFRFFYQPSFVRWLLRFRFPFGKRLLIIGGGFAGCELAEAFLEKGKQITILEESSRMAFDVGPSERFIVMSKFRRAKVTMETNTKVIEITTKGVKVAKKEIEASIVADSVVLAKGMKPGNGLERELEGKVPAVYAIGDCVDPKRIAEAVKSGFRVGRDI